MTMNWRKSPEALVRTFETLVPGDPDVERRKMFGYPAAFVGGNLFMSLFQDSLVLRLGDNDRATFLAYDGAAPFEPMPGRPMREYVTAPPAMIVRKKTLTPWIRKALEYGRSVPPKGAKRGTPAATRARTKGAAPARRATRP